MVVLIGVSNTVHVCVTLNKTTEYSYTVGLDPTMAGKTLSGSTNLTRSLPTVLDHSRSINGDFSFCLSD